MRGSRRAQKHYYENYDCISIENLTIKKSKYKSEYDAQNKNYGTEYEDTIVTKSCVNLDIKSINKRTVKMKVLMTMKFQQALILKIKIMKYLMMLIQINIKF